MAQKSPGFRGISTYKPIIVAVLVIFSLAMEVILHWVMGIEVVYSQFFYIPVVLAAVWYGVRSVGVAALLGGIQVLGGVYLTGDVVPGSLVRAGILVAVALVIGAVVDLMRREQARMLEEVTDAALKSATAPGGWKEGISDLRDRIITSVNVRRLREAGDARGLVRALDHKDPAIQYQAAEALGDLGDPAAVGPLAQALRGDEYSGVRWKAAEALARIGPPAVDALIEALADPDDDVRWKAAIALGEIGDPRGVAPLIGVLSDPDRFVQSRAAQALGMIGAPAVDALTTVLGDEEGGVHWGAVLALEKIGDPRAVPALVKASADPGGEVNPEIVAAIDGMGDAGFRELEQLLKSGEPRLRQNAVRVLGRLGREEAIAPLLQMLEHADGETRLLVGEALRNLGAGDIPDVTVTGERRQGPGTG
ncbi:HEAT repeat protein [Methanolinea mesophila]|uniref:HEAT repeat domain-containing protein n=1 Tax=Methanolinea mesophila TaxID=547055 RepID=UPI001AE18A52|nr:HEAT repeat domain-containing protein [Methanolinea mesophila]MBP1928738.1 HEAT repeat protein [Methanolinea mesophila]